MTAAHIERASLRHIPAHSQLEGYRPTGLSPGGTTKCPRPMTKRVKPCSRSNASARSAVPGAIPNSCTRDLTESTRWQSHLT